MKHVFLIFCIVCVSCKNKSDSETKSITASEIDTSGIAMWSEFIQAHPEYKNEGIPDADFFSDNKEDADRLAALTVQGKKKATSGLYSLYKQYNVALPKVGRKHIITDFDGNAKAIIATTSVDTIPFNKVSDAYAALDMGTTIDALQKWRKAHWEFFENFTKEGGEKPTEGMLLVCEQFEAIWTEVN